ncbi:3-oxoacyl-[acyl-carrier-protein] reductase FabG [Grifola frondosa]|uniref:3-oxoacyl-[acyl-carrier-protein] reductase n=1 Tax=Grifola frondosa TaxID=5627 RepID=A0A1C7MGA9_GRIFR|nr:3-oxoacyl-[acyl-carrier-protein] reductase FabG [Grifola frondosa]
MDECRMRAVELVKNLSLADATRCDHRVVFLAEELKACGLILNAVLLEMRATALVANTKKVASHQILQYQSNMSVIEPSLQGKLVLITGCTGGIGQATARAFARHGCSIAVHHSSQKSKAKADVLVSELMSLAPGVRAAPFEADLSSYENARTLHAHVVKGLGHPDILFSNHGVTGPVIGPEGDIGKVSAEVFEEIWRTNTGTAYLLAQLCVPYMESKKWGRIIFTSSVAAGNGGILGPQYASSKSALHGLVHWLSLRYSKDGITANAIAPALIEDTAMMSNPSDAVRSKIPIGRLGKPDEIASIVLLLATNGYMTNKVIVADGGWTIGGF